jgi:cation diffusion facilitator family transporter
VTDIGSREPVGYRTRAIYRVTIVGMLANLLLAAAKLAAGIVGRSAAMIADAVHSVSDLATDVIVIAFVGIAAKPRDDSHDYGHGKFETLASVTIGLALTAAAVGILVGAVESIVLFAEGARLPQPGTVALAAAAVSLVVKEVLFRYTRRVGLRVNSPAMTANAWHHRSDALSSVGALLGIGGAFFLGERWRVLDPAAAVVVSVLIGKAAITMMLPALKELLEASLPADIERAIMTTIRSVDGVRDPHGLRTRRIGPEIVIDVHVRMARDLTVEVSHRITQEVERKLRARFGVGTIVMIHVEPGHDSRPVS